MIHKIDMQNEFINGSGWFITAFAGFLNVNNWLTSINFNQWVTLFISILSAIFLVMKIYDQFLITQNRKKE